MHLNFDFMIMPEDLQCLKVIARMGGSQRPVRVSSQSLGESLGISPQTASRRLQSLERQKLVERSLTPDGQDIMVTSTGESVLRREYEEYCQIFGEDHHKYTLKGSVITGLGEGRYYMSLEPYRVQFERHLGFVPFPGTLNIRLDPRSLPVRKRLEGLEWIPIEGFVADQRTFGSVRCIPCRIGEIKCGIVVPGRTHYPEDVLEIVAPVGLRDALGISDGDTVEVEVEK
jgi:riboflavin kinase